MGMNSVASTHGDFTVHVGLLDLHVSTSVDGITDLIPLLGIVFSC